MSHKNTCSLISHILIIFVFLYNGCVSCFSNDFNFDRISLEDGLSNNSVYAFLEDKDGFIWFGTQDGLCRYDGYGVKVFKHTPGNPNTLSDDWILALEEDSSGNIWIGTNSGGLNRLNRTDMRITHLRHKVGHLQSLPSDRVWALLCDPDDTLWVGLFGGGIRTVNKETEEFDTVKVKDNDSDDMIPVQLSDDRVVNLFLDSKDRLWIATQNGLNSIDLKSREHTVFLNEEGRAGSIPDNSIWDVVEDSNHVIWVATERGLSKYNEASGEFTSFVHDEQNNHSICDNRVWSIKEFQGRLWLGTMNGLSVFNPLTEQCDNYTHNPVDAMSISENEIWKISTSSSGVLWVLTNGGGVNRFSPYKQRFKYLGVEPFSKHSLSGKRVRAIWKDSDGFLWVGIIGGGLNRVNTRTGQIDVFRSDKDNPNTLQSNEVTCIYEDSLGYFWVGTWGGGLHTLNRKTMIFKSYRHSNDDKNSICSDIVQCIFEDSNGDFWVGTNRGLNRMNRQEGVFETFLCQKDNENSISDNRIQSNSIIEEEKGVLWVGTFGGLNQMNTQTGVFKRYLHKEDDPDSLSNNRIICVFKDKSGRVWAGTYGGGVNLYDRDRDCFIRINTRFVINDTVYGIEEDNGGHLWMSTNNGIYHLNYDENILHRFDLHDGLQSNQFMWGAVHKDADDILYFGGIDGLNYFFCDEIQMNNKLAPTAITSFKVFENPYPLVDMNQKKQIDLSYKENFFSFEFSALDYHSPEKNQYAYMLEGLDKDWVYSGSRRYASYTDVEGGRYTFRVKACNNDGLWDEAGLSVPVNIKPPFYKTLSFRGFSILLFFAVLYFIYLWRVRNIRRQNAILEERIEEAKKEIKTLSSILPICSHCKKIRDDEGYWEEVDHYIISHTDTHFSHSVCPECVKELYPEFYKKQQKKQDN